MKQYRVVFRPAAESDLIALYDYICEREGTAVAVGYVDRIEAACLGLETFPLRGRLRTDIGSGIRTMGFERRATILYRVGRTDVTVIRILYGGRDLHRAFADL